VVHIPGDDDCILGGRSIEEFMYTVVILLADSLHQNPPLAGSALVETNMLTEICLQKSEKSFRARLVEPQKCGSKKQNDAFLLGIPVQTYLQTSSRVHALAK